MLLNFSILKLYYILTILFIMLILYDYNNINMILMSEKVTYRSANFGLYFSHLWSCSYNRTYVSEYKSQSDEDKIIYKTYYKNPIPYLNGIFVEIGALDGMKYSNSYFFEKSLGWKGLLVEGSPSNCKKLRRNQSIRNRSEILCAAICDSYNTLFIESDAIGGAENELPIRSWVNFTNAAKKRVLCTDLNTLISRYGITHIDVFFLDIEGSELTALKRFNFKVIVNYWIIEFNNKSISEHQQIKSLLYENGYLDCNIYIGKKNKCFEYKFYKEKVKYLKEFESRYYNNNGEKCL